MAMMLQDKINEDFKTAFKAKDENRASILRMLKAALINKGKEKQYQAGKQGKTFDSANGLVDEEVLSAVAAEIKKLRDSLVLFEKGDRRDLAQKAQSEIAILTAYLPPQLDENEIRELAAAAVKETGALSAKDMGRVMAILMTKIKGRAESGLVSQVVKELLQS